MENDLTNFIDKAYNSLLKIIIYKNILKDEGTKLFSKLISSIRNDKTNLETLTSDYYNLTSFLINSYSTHYKFPGDMWQNHILNLLLNDENVFSLSCEKKMLSDESHPIMNAVKHDLDNINILYKLNGSMIRKIIKQKFLLNFNITWETPSYSSKNHILDSINNTEFIEKLIKYYKTNGCGMFGKYKAFIYSNNSIKGIQNYDQIRFDDLIDYKTEQYELKQNTLQFLNDLPSNNILLYGDRGTGKSSSIKALLNEYSHMGLRIIEISKDDLKKLPEILEIIKNRGLYFIIFIDDLSFENNESQYRELKSVLEGSLEIKPSNVIIYATSNRRHLIKENFSERLNSDEITASDTLQEKLSLADRFGITITFSAPNQDKYLKIVENLAKKRNINISNEELRIKALKWEMWHNGKTPRTAKQFIDNLEGKIFLSKI